jgi:hypothetical protein
MRAYTYSYVFLLCILQSKIVRCPIRNRTDRMTKLCSNSISNSKSNSYRKRKHSKPEAQPIGIAAIQIISYQKFFPNKAKMVLIQFLSRYIRDFLQCRVVPCRATYKLWCKTIYSFHGIRKCCMHWRERKGKQAEKKRETNRLFRATKPITSMCFVIKNKI